MKVRSGLVSVLVATVGIAACGDDTTSSGATGGEGGNGDATTSSTATTTATTTTTSTTTTSNTTSSSSGGGEGGATTTTTGQGGSGGEGGAVTTTTATGTGGQGGAGGNGGADCASPTIVADGATVNGDTTGAPSLLQGSCQIDAGATPDLVYQVTPATTGPLTLVLDSAADLGLVVHTTCADPATEVGCADAAGQNGTEVLTVDATQGQPLFIYVGGWDAGAEGPFTLAINPAEVCGNGADDDGDGLADCEDPSCFADPLCPVVAVCAAAAPLQPSNAGDTTTGSSTFTGSCTGGGALEIVYSYTAAVSGNLQLTLQSVTDQGIYVRTDCDDTTSQLGCIDAAGGGTDELLSVGVTAGQTIFVFVDGYVPGTEGPFTLLGEFTPAPTPNEVEPNDSAPQANVYAAGYVGELPSAADTDWVSIVVPGPASTITIETVDLGQGICAPNLLDSEVVLYAPDGTTELGADDDAGAGYCSLLTVPNLAAGTYYVQVRESALAPDTTPYVYGLDITVN